MHDTNSPQHSDVTNNHEGPPPLRSPFLKPATDSLHAAVAPNQLRDRITGERPSADRIHTTDYNPAILPHVRSLYAIIDSVTDTILGVIQMHLNAASAIRTLYDLAASPETMINKHPEDYDLWLLGSLTNDHRILPNKMRLITGAQIATFLATGEKGQPETRR